MSEIQAKLKVRAGETEVEFEAGLEDVKTELHRLLDTLLPPGHASGKLTLSVTPPVEPPEE
jgi:hypothetical protein